MSDVRVPAASKDEPADPLQIEMHEQDRTVVLTVSGMAVVEVAGQFSRALLEAAGKRPRLLALDLSGLNFISSTALSGVVAAHVSCQNTGTKLCIVCPAPPIREILQVTRLDALLTLCDSLEEAEQQVVAG